MVSLRGNMQELIGKKVTITSDAAATERQDVGILESFDGTIVKLKTDKGPLYFVIHRVRLIKPF